MIETKPEHFINRELSWLEFNQRVLDEALNPETPLLERVKFFCIVSSNLDEFFEVRVAGIKQQIESSVVERSVDGLTATETLSACSAKIRKLVQRQYDCWRKELVPELERTGIRFRQVSKLSKTEQAWLNTYYHDHVHPVLTPLAIDPAHPFPLLLNKSLNIIVRLQAEKGKKKERMAVVQVPSILSRLIKLPQKGKSQDYVLLGELIGRYLPDLFTGNQILGWWLIRVTRNSELYSDVEDDKLSLLKTVESQLHKRRKGAAVRLEVSKGCPADIRENLLAKFTLSPSDLYVIDGPLSPSSLMSICFGDHSPELRDKPFVAPIAPSLVDKKDLFAAIREGDILLHHPYESFESIIDFLQQAAADPDVLAIKQTLYRTGSDTRIVNALMAATKAGKQVTAVVELRARFDEANNIEWARRLEEAGVHVVYGLVGYKIHCKACLVVRNEKEGIRRYLHLSTGNYNSSTSRLYTDIGLLTCDPNFGEDATNLFNILTGICQFHGMRRIIPAPFELHKKVVELIRRERTNAERGLPSRIIARMNSLVDEEVIRELYSASQAGVKIQLLIRGICCLRPGIPGISENISVISIIDRFLEHSRIFYFENACQPEVFVGSADWMPRNFFRRIESCFPILDGSLKDRVINEFLALSFKDNVKARHLQQDGSYLIPALPPKLKPYRSQEAFIDLAIKAAGDLKNLKSQKRQKKKMSLRSLPRD